MAASTATAHTAPTVAAPVTEMEQYLFDLRGYLVLKGAIDKDHVAELNAILDQMDNLDPPLDEGEWYGGVQAHTFQGGKDGINFQQVYEAGEPFERLIDHPSWFEKVQYFISTDSFDTHHAPLFIDENFANIRRSGGAIGMHSGGHRGTQRTQFRYYNGHFRCGQINILMALSDIGPGDGATMVVPGSHKANFQHPQFEQANMGKDGSLDKVEEAIEVHMQAGDVLLFVDAMSHGSARRVNDGERRICVYRYGPSWGMFRHPYRPTPALLERLTEQRRKIVWPHAPIKREPNRLPETPNPPDAVE